MADLTNGINPWQSVEGMVHDYEKQVAAEEAKHYDPDIQDGSIPKSEMDVNREAEALVAKGRLNPENGAEIPLTDKARRLTQWVPNQKFLDGFEGTRWYPEGDDSWKVPARD